MVNWDLFQSKSILIVKIFSTDENEKIISIVDFEQNALKCLTPEQIQSISSYTFVHNRAVWKGFPDLFVWNPSTKKCKVFLKLKRQDD